MRLSYSDKKERGIVERFAARLEKDLQALHEGLSRPRTQKKLVAHRAPQGEKPRRGPALPHRGGRRVAVTCEGSMTTHPGVYLRTETDWSGGADGAPTPRSLGGVPFAKSELGLRPI